MTNVPTQTILCDLDNKLSPKLERWHLNHHDVRSVPRCWSGARRSNLLVFMNICYTGIISLTSRSVPDYQNCTQAFYCVGFSQVVSLQLCISSSFPQREVQSRVSQEMREIVHGAVDPAYVISREVLHSKSDIFEGRPELSRKMATGTAQLNPLPRYDGALNTNLFGMKPGLNKPCSALGTTVLPRGTGESYDVSCACTPLFHLA